MWVRNGKVKGGERANGKWVKGKDSASCGFDAAGLRPAEGEAAAVIPIFAVAFLRMIIVAGMHGTTGDTACIALVLNG
jgi:hypothetical protein